MITLEGDFLDAVGVDVPEVAFDIRGVRSEE